MSIYIVLNFRFKWGWNMLVKQVSRVNFLALFWLISGLAGLIVPGQLMAFNSRAGGRELGGAGIGRLTLGAGGGPYRVGDSEDTEMRDFSVSVSASRGTSVSIGNPTAVGDVISRMGCLSVLDKIKILGTGDGDAVAAKEERAKIRHLLPIDPLSVRAYSGARADGVVTGTSRALDKGMYQERTIVARSRGNRRSHTSISLPMETVPEYTVLEEVVAPAPVELTEPAAHTPRLLVRPTAIRLPPSPEKPAVASVAGSAAAVRAISMEIDSDDDLGDL